MFSKTNLVSTLATAVWGNLGGWILWGKIMDPILVQHNATAGVMRAEADIDMVHLIIGSIVAGFFFSVIYGRYARESYTAKSGMLYGVLIGLLIGLGEGLVNFSVMNMLDITGTFINAATYVVFYAIMGAIAGMVYQKVS